jgi:hypothetical protein
MKKTSQKFLRVYRCLAPSYPKKRKSIHGCHANFVRLGGSLTADKKINPPQVPEGWGQQMRNNAENRYPTDN